MRNKLLAELGLDYNAPLYALSVGQYIEMQIALSKGTIAQPKDERSFLFGIRGIEREFGVSHKTAQAWKNTWLSPAIEQTGKTILCDKAMAHELLKARMEGRK